MCRAVRVVITTNAPSAAMILKIVGVVIGEIISDSDDLSEQPAVAGWFSGGILPARYRRLF